MGRTTLRADRIAETADVLSRRIKERFPDSGLAVLSEELCDLGARAQLDAPTIGRPLWWVRIGGGVLILLILLAGAVFIQTMLARADQVATAELPDMLEGLDAATNILILFGLVIFFLVTLEIRIKRARVLNAVHELRSMAHVIDMHQLTKDPDFYRGETLQTKYSPRHNLTLPLLKRYLDYCSEMLSITSKIAALYIQRFNDSAALDAVSDLEILCDGLSRKVWQKMGMAEDISDHPIGKRVQ
jgi:hypothetical protein